MRVFAHRPRCQRYVLIWRNVDTNWVSEYQRQSSLSLSLSLCRCTVSPSSCTVSQPASNVRPTDYTVSVLYTDLTPTCSLFRCLHYTIPLVTHNCLEMSSPCPVLRKYPSLTRCLLSSVLVFIWSSSRIHYFWLKLTNEGQNYNWRELSRVIASICHQQPSPTLIFKKNFSLNMGIYRNS